MPIIYPEREENAPTIAGLQAELAAAKQRAHDYRLWGLKQAHKLTDELAAERQELSKARLEFSECIADIYELIVAPSGAVRSKPDLNGILVILNDARRTRPTDPAPAPAETSE